MYDVLLSWQLTLIKSSRTITHVSSLKTTNITGIISLPLMAVMIGTEMVPEMFMVFNELTWLIAYEDFINYLPNCMEQRPS
jgi:hypothetical protein